jgi:hypothetical protein
VLVTRKLKTCKTTEVYALTFETSSNLTTLLVGTSPKGSIVHTYEPVLSIMENAPSNANSTSIPFGASKAGEE